MRGYQNSTLSDIGHAFEKVWRGRSCGVQAVDLEDDVLGSVELELVVGTGALAGPGVVDEVDLPVRLTPQVDPAEGLFHGPLTVRLEAVVEPPERAVVVQPGLEVLLTRAFGRRDVLLGVVDIDLASRVGGEGGTVGRRPQVHCPTMSVRDLVSVDGGLSGEVDDGLDDVAVQRAQMLVHELMGHRVLPLPADHATLALLQGLGCDVDV